MVLKHKWTVVSARVTYFAKKEAKDTDKSNSPVGSFEWCSSYSYLHQVSLKDTRNSLLVQIMDMIAHERLRRTHGNTNFLPVYYSPTQWDKIKNNILPKLNYQTSNKFNQ